MTCIFFHFISKNQLKTLYFEKHVLIDNLLHNYLVVYHNYDKVLFYNFELLE